MVNEINKPNDPLSERLAASNRQLREMQEEHRQLLEEMEVLRTRATELSRLNVQRQQLQQHVMESSQSEEIVSETTSSSTTSSSMQSMTTATVSKMESRQEIKAEAISTNMAAIASTGDEDIKDNVAESLEKLTITAVNEAEDAVDAESADYLQQKIAEIAALKAQYKRVEHMVNTTDLIEQHLKTKSSATKIQTNMVEAASSSSSTVGSLETSGTTGTPDGSKEELVSAMLNMFTDFSDDLRGQAASLREERERIRALKEELIVRRKGNS